MEFLPLCWALLGAAAALVGCSDDAGGAIPESPAVLDASEKGDRARASEGAVEVDSAGSTAPPLDAPNRADTDSADAMTDSSRTELDAADEARPTTPNHALKLDGIAAQVLFPASVP